MKVTGAKSERRDVSEPRPREGAGGTEPWDSDMGHGAVRVGKWAVGEKQEKSSTGLEKSRIKTVVPAGREREGFERSGVMGWGRPGRELRMVPEAVAAL